MGRGINRDTKVVAEDATPARGTSNWRAMEAPIIDVRAVASFVEAAERLRMILGGGA
jgi:hypothetical protein